MPSPQDTAYPRLKQNPSATDLDEIYTPTPAEMSFAKERTRQPSQRLGLLLLLKTFQRLGYFVLYEEIPAAIVCHIASHVEFSEISEQMHAYDQGTARDRHMSLIREFLGVTAYGSSAKRVIIETCKQAASTRDDLPDIINRAIEELVRQRYELPAFSTLLRIARTTRNQLNREYQTQIYQRLDAQTRQQLQDILAKPEPGAISRWEQIKQEPKRASLPHFKDFLQHLNQLRQHNIAANTFSNIPEAKIRQFEAEAGSLDLSSINDMPERKRLTLVAALLFKQVARALDDAADLFIRQVNRMHHNAKDALEQYRIQNLERTDALIAHLREITIAYKAEGTREQRMSAIENLLEDQADQILADCDAHSAIAGNNHLSFLPQFYSSRRSAFFLFLENVSLVSTSQDTALIQAISFLLENRKARSEWLKPTTPLNISFLTERWWVLVTEHKDRLATISRLHRRSLELAVFNQIMLELKSGDLCIPGSNQFSDYRTELISKEDYQTGLALYGEQAGIPVEGKAFISNLYSQLQSACRDADQGFPDNAYLDIENGKPFLKRLRAKPDPAGLRNLEQQLNERMGHVDIIDVLADTEHWLQWTRAFKPISGHDAKIQNPRERYIATTFCYGCNLGPSQIARSIKGLDRRQVSFINQRHITEESLNQAITTVINAYTKLPLQQFWGSGKSASADGTQWELHPQNLMSEYHIRYGGYGGIGYYMVSDSYIALFSRFSTCGAWEGHYILDFINENTSDVQPDTIHADTQGQSIAIFGLAYLLGIQLMPRIRNWKKLDFCRPGVERFSHIDTLFNAQVDWNLIETMLPDMLRVAMSIKAGTIMPSTILRRLTTYSRKNKLYFAFCELGRVIRTIFLLKYLSSLELRHIIQSATNKSEAFNQFVQWVCFGGQGLIIPNARDEQRKFIKYNHLVANLLAFHNLVSMTKVIQELRSEGKTIDWEALSVLSPYRTEHINRFGNYVINTNRIPEPLDDLMNFSIPLSIS